MFRWIKNNFIKIFLFIFFLFSSVFVYQFLIITKPKAIIKKVEKKVLNVNVLQTKVEDFTPNKYAYGNIVSQRNGDLRFGIFGKVTFVSPNLLNGSSVKKGEVLAKLDQSRYKLEIDKLNVKLEELEKKLELKQKLIEIKKLKQQLEELKIQFNLKKKQINRNKVMLEKKVISPSYHENELINFSKLKSDYEKISFNLKKAKENMSDQVFRNKIEVKKTKINLRKAKKDLDDTILRSEFNGLISNVNISLGQFVSNSHKVADIKSTENKEVEFIVPVSVYSKSANLLGKKVKIIWESSGKVMISSEGLIVRDDGIAREAEGGGKIYAKIFKNSKDIPLGSFVKINYPLDTFYSIIKLPETAVYKNENVFINDNGVSKKVSVNVRHKGQGFVLIDSDNIKDKSVIINRFSMDINGRKIKVFD
tara:strand:- start:97 stop:1359 length:1263 start_codon:yes stop_codon:yes gene_type:complete